MKNFYYFSDYLKMITPASYDRFPPAILLSGDESFFKKRILLHLTKKLSAKKELLQLSYNGTELKFDALWNELFTPFFFTQPKNSAKLINIFRAEHFARANKAALAKYMTSPAKNTLLVFDMEEARQYDFSALTDAGAIWVACLPVRDPQLLIAYIERIAKELGKKIQPHAAAYLHNLLGFDLQKINSQMENLALSTKDETITLENVRKLIDRDLRYDVFDYTDAVAGRNSAEAFNALRYLISNDVPTELLIGTLSWKYVTLAAVKKVLDAKGRAYADDLKRLKLSQDRFNETAYTAKIYTLQQLTEAVRLILKTDTMVKTGTMPQDLAMETLTARLTMN